MFEVNAKNETLSRFLKSAHAINRKCCIIKTTGEKIQIPVVDESNSAQGEIEMDLEAFSSYNVEPQTFVINLSTMVEIVDAGDDDSVVTIEKVESKGIIDVSVGAQDYKLSLITKADYQYKSLDIDYDLTITFGEEDFKQAIDAADVFSDEILFKYDSQSDSFIFKGKGDSNITKRELESDELVELSGDDSEATYGLSVLKSIKDVVPTGTEITVNMAENRPIEIEYAFENGHGKATYFLAPRLKE
ncbi:hypothetical protein ACLI4Z_10825 [Natrialbaceae archaeon A-arb3/5]